jgi:hypothetical protein
MEKPLELLKNLARLSDHILLWTHYFDRDIIWAKPKIRSKFADRAIVSDGVALWRYNYLDALQWSGFCGGPLQFSMWMTKPALIATLRNCGFHVTETMDHKDHPNGPCILLYARRTL